jgi:hypothetical protein
MQKGMWAASEGERGLVNSQEAGPAVIAAGGAISGSGRAERAAPAPTAARCDARARAGRALGMVMPRRPSMPAKRSKPLCLTPPKGRLWHM